MAELTPIAKVILNDLRTCIKEAEAENKEIATQYHRALNWFRCGLHAMGVSEELTLERQTVEDNREPQ